MKFLGVIALCSVFILMTAVPAALAQNQVSLPPVTVDASAVADDTVWGDIAPTQPDDEHAPPWQAAPEHTLITLKGYTLTDHNQTAQIRVYPVEAYRDRNETAAEEISKLNTFLDNHMGQKGMTDSTAMPDSLPHLPPNGASQMIDAQIKVLNFENGSGVRYLTQFGQAVGAINNKSLIYTFQGITTDGQYYVSAIMPVTHPELGDDITAFPSDDFEGYIAGITETLNNAGAESFTPSLTELDGMIESLDVMAAAHEMDDSAVQLDAQAQEYIRLARADLAERLNRRVEDVELDSITRLAEPTETYIIRLQADGMMYEYHGVDNSVQMVSHPLPVAPASLQGTQWTLVDYGMPDDATSVIENSTITLELDDQGGIAGDAGCNSYSGQYTLEGSTIEFREIISTLMACMDEDIMQQEQTFFHALQNATRYELNGDQLLIWYDRGSARLRFAATMGR